MHEFTAPDAAGTVHRYEVTLHRGSAGQRLALRLCALLIEPLAEAVGPLLLEGISDVKSIKGLLDNPDVLSALDMPAVGRAARSAILTVDDATIFEVLRYTNRDGQPLVDATGKPTRHYDEAYAANYAELGRALWGAAKVNGFFPVPGTSGSGSASASSPAPGQLQRRA